MFDFKMITSYLQRKHLLLWVCQRYDVKADLQPHECGISKEDVIIKYRNEKNTLDTTISKIYWEEIWIQGVYSKILNEIRTGFVKNKGRQPIVLASENDSKVRIQNNLFLPINCLYGVMDETLPRSAQFDTLKPRVRERVARELASRIQLYDNRLLIVIGAKDYSDIKLLVETLEDFPAFNIKIVIISKHSFSIDTSDMPCEFIFAHYDTSDFFSKIMEAGAPQSLPISNYTIRYGNKFLEIDPAIYELTSKEFKIIIEQDLLMSNSFLFEDFLAFLDGDINNWKGYSAGMAIEREYETELGQNFDNEIETIFTEVKKSQDKQLGCYVELPSEGGAGSTTLIRNTAYNCAMKGYPVLIYNNFQTDFELERIQTYINNITESASSVGIEEHLPIIIFFDKPQSSVTNIRQLPLYFSLHGRKTIVIHAVDAEEDKNYAYSKSDKVIKLPKLRAEAKTTEIVKCSSKFAEIVNRYKLPIIVPKFSEWVDKDGSSWWIYKNTKIQIKTFFWVALRYFFTEGLDFSAAETAQDSLGRWIKERIDKITDAPTKYLLNYVAVFSSWRILCPLWSALRPITGGTFTNKISTSLKLLNDLIEWSEFDANISDHFIAFKHPSLANEILRQQDVRTNEEKLEIIKPVIAQLSAGHSGDTWLAKAISYDILSPRKDQFLVKSDVEWRLKGFELIPPEIGENDKSILHHWARCLYQAAYSLQSETQCDLATQKSWLELSIEKLHSAIQLPKTSTRNEPLSQLYNTLGTAYARYALFLKQQNFLVSDVNKAWDNSFYAFTKGLDETKWQDIKALLSFSFRIIKKHDLLNYNYQQHQLKPLDELSSALFMLDQAEEIISLNPSLRVDYSEELHSYRSQILGFLNTEAVNEYITRLKEGENPELGYYCHAKLVSERGADPTNIQDAINILEQANRNLNLSPKSLYLLLNLYNKHQGLRFDFQRLFDVYLKIEKSGTIGLRPIDIFRMAVLCYQIERFEEGKERFRILRSILRRDEIPFINIREVWRNNVSPYLPRETYFKVQRIYSEWKGDALVEEIAQVIPFRPRHFPIMPKVGYIEKCGIRFEPNGPFAVPLRFIEVR